MLAAVLIAPAAAYADTTGLVAAYGFEEPSGTTAIDTSPSGNTGTLSSGVSRSTAGRFGRALSFGAAGQRVNVADSNSLDLSTGMTLEAWVNPSAASSEWRTVVIKEQPAALAYALYSDEGGARPSVHAFTSQEFDVRGPAALPLNTWSHLSSTYDGATLRLYVNGTQVASRALTGALTTSTGALRIGGNAVWGEHFSGLIDEVRVYNRALTAAEIGTDMNAAIIGGDSTAPTAPGPLTTSVAGDDVTLEWGASTDAVGVTGYRIHRAGTAGFTPSAANLITTVTGLNLTDMNRPNGTWYYRVVAVDAAGNASAASNEESVTLAIDNTPPTAPGPLTTSVADDDVALAWGASTDAVGVTGYRIHRAGTAGFTPSAANLITTVTGLSLTDMNRPNGTAYYRVVAIDAAGNASAASNEASATVTPATPPDTTPPTVSVTSACPKTISGNSGNAFVAGTAADDVGVVGNIEIRLDGEPLWVTMHQSPSASSWVAEWDTYYTPNGTYSVTAVARDLAGNETVSAPCEITVDNAPISVGFVSPADAATVSGTVTLKAFSGLGAGPFPGAWYLFRVDGVALGTPFNGGTERPWNTTGLADGTHTLTVELRNFWPNDPPYATETIQVTVDNADHTPPDVPTLTGVADDIDGEAHLSWSPIGGGAGDRLHRSATSGFTPSDDNLIATTASGQRIDPRPVGTWYYRVVAVDDAGNRAAPSNEVAVTIAPVSLPPTVSITEPAAAATVSGSVPVTASAADDEGVSSVQFKLDGDDLGSPDADAPYAVTWDTGTAGNGPHSLTAVARDADGHATTSDAVTVTVSNGIAGLVAAYGFEETTGTAVTDSSGSGNAGTIAGATRSASGKYGRALSFDGVNDLVTVPHAASLSLTTNLTLEAWVRPAAISGKWRTVLMKERTGGMAFALYAVADLPRPSANVFASGSEIDAIGPAQLPLNTWSHLAMTYDSITMRLYVNDQVATRPLTSPVVTATGAVRIGGNNIWPEWFSGLIDEVRVYSRALTAAEVAAGPGPVVDAVGRGAGPAFAMMVELWNNPSSWLPLAPVPPVSRSCSPRCASPPPAPPRRSARTAPTRSASARRGSSSAAPRWRSSRSRRAAAACAAAAGRRCPSRPRSSASPSTSSRSSPRWPTPAWRSARSSRSGRRRR